MTPKVKYFTETSSDGYGRHHYKVVSNDGRSVVVEDYESVRSIWWNSKYLSHVEVLDIKKGGKGF
mgnify:CR=1 FL=1